MMQVFDKLPRWLVWEIALPLAILNGWLLYQVFQAFQTVFTILIAATLLSFLLNYPIDQLERRGIKRGISITVIGLVVVSLVGILGITLLPILLQQLEDLATRLPQWLDSGNQQFQIIDAWLTAKRIPLDVTALMMQFQQLFPDELAQLPDQTLDIILGLTDRLVEVVITTVLTLYLMLHGEEFWSGLLRWLPGDLGNEFRLVFQEQFRNYFVGQATIALLMTIILTLLFFVLNIPYWLVFGMSIGLLTLVPFGDTVGVLTAAVIVAFKSVLLGGELALVSLITDQVIDNVVAPKVIGHLVGLNPVWILISLLIGAQLAGALGLLLAVPLASSIKRLINELVVEPSEPRLD